MDEKRVYYMQDHRKLPSRHVLTETDAEQLREKGWTAVPVDMVKDEVHGHFHVFDSNGQYMGSRMLDAVQAADHVRQGCHLVHVGDGAMDLDEIQVIEEIRAKNQ